jgi:hypothetical protein
MKPIYCLLPLLVTLTACGIGAKSSYSDADEAKEYCRDMGFQGPAFARCVTEREHVIACQRFVDSREYTAAEARRRNCQGM